MNLSPQQLDNQLRVKIDRWIDLDSTSWKEMDQDPQLTKKMLRLGMQQPPFLFVDALGRIFGQGKDGYYYPFHIEYKNQLIGLRLCKYASN